MSQAFLYAFYMYYMQLINPHNNHRWYLHFSDEESEAERG